MPRFISYCPTLPKTGIMIARLWLAPEGSVVLTAPQSG